MSFLIKKFVESILDKGVDRTIEDVPMRYRDQVKQALDEHYAKQEEISAE
ncbi:CD1375 family protein [Listeria cornellensis]|nr:CD1375 family protein [Listeria cornellensis]